MCDILDHKYSLEVILWSICTSNFSLYYFPSVFSAIFAKLSGTVILLQDFCFLVEATKQSNKKAEKKDKERVNGCLICCLFIPNGNWNKLCVSVIACELPVFWKY